MNTRKTGENESLAVLEQFRPGPERLDPDWSQTTLASITSQRPGMAQRTGSRTPAMSMRKRLSLVGAGVLGAGVLGTSVAVAGGFVPQFVTEAFSNLDKTSPYDFDVSNIKPIADFTLPDNTEFKVWRGTNKDGSMCQAERQNVSNSDPEDVTVWCYVDESAGRFDQVDFTVIWPADVDDDKRITPKYYVAYGQSPTPDASTVRITGHGTDLTLPIDPVTQGFGGTLPDLKMTPDGEKFELTYSFHDQSEKEVAVLTHGWG